MTKDTLPKLSMMILASQDVQEVMFVSDSLTESVMINRLY